jgi:polyhydroxybutyrate depolymerase
MRVRLLVGLGVFALLALAPAGPGAASSTKGSHTTATTVGSCSDASVTGTHTLSLRLGGRNRTVIVHLPPLYTGTTALPLVLNLHDSGSTAARQEVLSGMDSEADQDGFVVVYPQAAVASGDGFDWSEPGLPFSGGATTSKNPPDDLAFLTQLVGILESRYCVNSARVYVTGFAAGAEMASQLGCDDSNIFAAIAPVSGLRLPTSCPTVRGVPVIAFHGTADPVDPYEGHGRVSWTYSVPQAARDWASHDGCRGRPQVIPEAVGVTLTDYVRCANHAQVALVTINGEGHEWPGGPLLPRSVTRVFGPQSDVVNADALIWSFFEAHKL